MPERPRLGAVVGGNPVAVQAHDVGHVTRFVDHLLDHPGQTACQVSWLVLACKAALAGAPGESYDLAVDPGAARTGTLELLQDEKTAALAGREPGVGTVVGSDQSRHPVGCEAHILELSVRAATVGYVKISFADLL